MAVKRFGTWMAVVAIGMVVAMSAVDLAEARRASGGFGSRGTRTFAAPPITRTAPNTAAPIDKSMTPRQQAPQGTQPAAGQNAAGAATPRPGLFGGFGGALLGGLAMGGLLGMMFGGGFGGAAGMLGMLLQIALIFGAVMLAMRFFRGRQRPSYSGPASGPDIGSANAQRNSGVPSFPIPRMGSGNAAPAASSGFGSGFGAAAPAKPVMASDASDEVGITPRDLDRFEVILKDLQAAYAAENYADLRRVTTPEAMSYLAEELSENATKGLRNEVRDVQLVQGDVSEAWRESGLDYATVAMRYESIDVMRDRTSGAVVGGSADQPTETVELWTFVRKQVGGDWQVAAIQSVEG